MEKKDYLWTDNPAVSGVAVCDTDVLNDCMMHLKYNNSNGLPLFLMLTTDRALVGDEAVGWALQGSYVTMTYPDAVNMILSEYDEGVDTTYRGISCKRSFTGRYIADISKKEAVDELYALTGIVDFYLVDTVNKAFYLPKTRWFSQFTNDLTRLNMYNEAGLPNIEGSAYVLVNTNMSLNGTGALRSEANSVAGVSGSNFQRGGTMYLDASLANSIYGKSATVQPPSSNKFIYYKVGDVVAGATTALIDAKEFLAGSLTDIADATADGISAISNASNAINRTSLTNCILEAPGGGIAYTETTVTAKAGLRYLTGNGRNADYTLKTAEHTLQNDVSVTFNGFGANTQGIAYIFNGALMYCPINEVYHIDNSPTVEAPVANAGTNQLWFEKWNNVVYHSIYGSTEWVLTTDCVIIGTFYPNSSGKITGIRRNRPVDILKRSDKNEVAGWGFPSSTYIDLTLSGTGTAYTAPADGYVVFGKQSTAIDQHVLLVQSGAVWQICWATAVGANLFVSMPVKKGRIFNASYTTLGPTQVFRFYYAEGAKP